MSVQVKRRREAASFLATFTGAQGELIVDTTNNRVQVHDGATAGGFPAAKLSEVPVAPSAHGAALSFGLLEDIITCSGASSASTQQIPVGAIVLGISCRVITAITGAGGFWVDPTTDFNGAGGAYTANGKFGFVGAALNTTNDGLPGSPLASYFTSTITLTGRNAGNTANVNFTGGVVRIAIMYLIITPPTS